MNIDAILEKHRDALMDLENVVGVGEGELNGQPVIQVLVTRKMQLNELPASQRIPDTLDGVLVVVQDVGGPIEAQSL